MKWAALWVYSALAGLTFSTPPLELGTDWLLGFRGGGLSCGRSSRFHAEGSQRASLASRADSRKKSGEEASELRERDDSDLVKDDLALQESIDVFVCLPAMPSSIFRRVERLRLSVEPKSVIEFQTADLRPARAG